MNPHTIARARAWRESGLSDARIGAALKVTRQAVHAALGPRPRRAPPARPAPPPAPNRVEFAAALKAWRARHGYSQAAAARALRVTAHSVSSWELQRCGCALAASMTLLMQCLDNAT